ncbi:MAG: threonine/serine exporter family protein [Planctomycetes bacterium]|nr:threonine/serine exporter family protein [Planctomycetota bacterium]
MSAQDFVIELGRAMHALGSASYRVEDSMDACCRRFGLSGSFFATPTAIFAAIGPIGAKADTTLLRVRPGQHDLGKLTALYAVRDAVVLRGLDADEGRLRVAAIINGPPTQPWIRRIPAWAIGSAAAAIFLGGGFSECWVAAVTGLIVAVLGLLMDRRAHLGRIFEPVACALAAFLVHFAGHFVPLDSGTAIIASIVPLLPGLTFTTALAELAMQHLAAGSARLLGAIAVLVTMTVGIGLGGRLGAVVFGEFTDRLSAPLGPIVSALSILCAALAYSVLLRASWRQVPWVLVAILACAAGSWFGSIWFDRELSAFFGALAVALAANVYSHLFRRPAAVLRTPGLLLLVPGSLGLRGLSNAMQGGFSVGSEFAFRMVLVGGAIVAGMLIASALLPPPIDVEPDAERSQGNSPR